MKPELDPVELTATIPVHPSREQTEKSLWERQPGHIAWSVGTAHHAGCRVLTFLDSGVEGLMEDDNARFQEELAFKRRPSSPAEFMNAYFSTRANLLVVDMKPDCGTLHVIVTNQLDPDDLDIMQEIQQLNQQMYAEARKRIEDRNTERRQKLQTEQAEQKRLAAIGKTAEDHNILGRFRELEEENAALRKQLAGDK